MDAISDLAALNGTGGEPTPENWAAVDDAIRERMRELRMLGSPARTRDRAIADNHPPHRATRSRAARARAGCDIRRAPLAVRPSNQHPARPSREEYGSQGRRSGKS